MSNTAFTVDGTSGGGSGTVTSVTAGTGLTATPNPITTVGTINAGTELAGLSSLGTTGIVVRTGSGTYATTSVDGTAGQIGVANGDGVSGPPTASLVATGVSAGTYSNPTMTVDTYGRVSSIASNSSAGLLMASSTLSSANLYAGGLFTISPTPSGSQVYVPINWLFESLFQGTAYIGAITVSLGYNNSGTRVSAGLQNFRPVDVVNGYYTSSITSGFLVAPSPYAESWYVTQAGFYSSVAGLPLALSLSSSGLSDGNGTLRVTVFYIVRPTS